MDPELADPELADAEPADPDEADRLGDPDDLVEPVEADGWPDPDDLLGRLARGFAGGFGWVGVRSERVPRPVDPLGWVADLAREALPVDVPAERAPDFPAGRGTGAAADLAARGLPDRAADRLTGGAVGRLADVGGTSVGLGVRPGLVRLLFRAVPR